MTVVQFPPKRRRAGKARRPSVDTALHPFSGSSPGSIEREEELFLALGSFWFEPPPLHLQRNPIAVEGLAAIHWLMDAVDNQSDSLIPLAILACICDPNRYKFDLGYLPATTDQVWAAVEKVFRLMRVMTIDIERDLPDRGTRLRRIVRYRRFGKCEVRKPLHE